MSKTTEQRIEEIITRVCETKDFYYQERELLKHQLEALVLSAKLDQLKESK